MTITSWKVSQLRKSAIKVQTLSIKPLYISISFRSKTIISDIKNEMRKLVSEYYRQLNLRFIFTNNFSIRSFFKFKDRVSAQLFSSVAYSFSYGQCQATQTEKISCHLHTRALEHRGISPVLCCMFIKVKIVAYGTILKNLISISISPTSKS